MSDLEEKIYHLRTAMWVVAACCVVNTGYAQNHQGPSKMQRCQAELAGVEGNDRKIQLRQCLVNRTEGERLATRDCAKQLRELPPNPAADKALRHKKCIATALNVAHAQLPKRAVVAAAESAKPAAAEPAAQGAKAP